MQGSSHPHPHSPILTPPTIPTKLGSRIPKFRRKRTGLFVVSACGFPVACPVPVNLPESRLQFPCRRGKDTRRKGALPPPSPAFPTLSLKVEGKSGKILSEKKKQRKKKKKDFLGQQFDACAPRGRGSSILCRRDKPVGKHGRQVFEAYVVALEMEGVWGMSRK